MRTIAENVKFGMRNSQTAGGGGAWLLRPWRLIGALVVATSVGVAISASTAGAGDASGYVRRASCTLIRYYVAKYSAPAVWARSKGATDAEINTARRCLTPQHTAQVGRTDRAF
jgi:hypothetical protein